MNRTRELACRVRHGVNRVSSEQTYVARSQFLATALDERLTITTEERVVLAADVQADGRPHAMVVRVERHPRRPDDIDDRQVVGNVQRSGASSFRW
jgi:hypothetical protein